MLEVELTGPTATETEGNGRGTSFRRHPGDTLFKQNEGDFFSFGDTISSTL